MLSYMNGDDCHFNLRLVEVAFLRIFKKKEDLYEAGKGDVDR